MEESAEPSHNQSVELPTDLKEIAGVALVGAGAGLLVLLQALILSRFFIEPVFCRSTDAFAVCANGGVIAFNAALIIISVAAITVLVKINIYRPLLVAVGPAASLWSISAYLGRLSVVEYIFWTTVLFSLLYVLFYWLMHLRKFVFSLIAFIVAVVLIRVTLAI